MCVCVFQLSLALPLLPSQPLTLYTFLRFTLSERTEKVLEITKEQLAKLMTEKYGKPMTVDDKQMAVYKTERTKEGRSINNSLTTLGRWRKAKTECSFDAFPFIRQRIFNLLSHYCPPLATNYTLSTNYTILQVTV
jgi:hypothetical protein